MFYFFIYTYCSDMQIINPNMTIPKIKYVSRPDFTSTQNEEGLNYVKNINNSNNNLKDSIHKYKNEIKNDENNKTLSNRSIKLRSKIYKKSFVNPKKIHKFNLNKSKNVNHGKILHKKDHFDVNNVNNNHFELKNINGKKAFENEKTEILKFYKNKIINKNFSLNDETFKNNFLSNKSYTNHFTNSSSVNKEFSKGNDITKSKWLSPKSKTKKKFLYSDSPKIIETEENVKHVRKKREISVIRAVADLTLGLPANFFEIALKNIRNTALEYNKYIFKKISNSIDDEPKNNLVVKNNNEKFVFVKGNSVMVPKGVKNIDNSTKNASIQDKQAVFHYLIITEEIPLNLSMTPTPNLERNTVENPVTTVESTTLSNKEDISTIKTVNNSSTKTKIPVNNVGMDISNSDPSDISIYFIYFLFSVLIFLIIFHCSRRNG